MSGVKVFIALEALRDNRQGELCDSLPRIPHALAVGEHARKVDDVRDPTTVRLLFKLYGENKPLLCN
jgi:hypothetical protein